MIQTRFELPELFPPGIEKIVGVEVGTDQGVYASHLLRHYLKLFLYTVDPWLPYPEIRDDRFYAKKQYRANMVEHEGRYQHIQASSTVAARRLETRKVEVDFVYIDAAHDSKNVRSDLRSWWPLVRPSGLMAIHDLDLPSVSSVVIEFSRRNRLDLCIINEHGGPDTLPDKKGSGMDIYGGWAHPTGYFFKDKTGT